MAASAEARSCIRASPSCWHNHALADWLVPWNLDLVSRPSLKQDKLVRGKQLALGSKFGRFTHQTVAIRKEEVAHKQEVI